MKTLPVFFISAALVATAAIAGCSLTATRPTQEFSDTTAAIRAAKEVQADTLAPELFRQANEWFFRARKEYKMKNFKIAEEYSRKARRFAEQAEFESVRNAGNSTERVPEPANQPAPTPTSTPYEYPTPEGTPFDRATPDPTSGSTSGSPQAPAPAPNAVGTPP